MERLIPMVARGLEEVITTSYRGIATSMMAEMMIATDQSAAMQCYMNRMFAIRTAALNWYQALNDELWSAEEVDRRKQLKAGLRNHFFMKSVYGDLLGSAEEMTAGVEADVRKCFPDLDWEQFNTACQYKMDPVLITNMLEELLARQDQAVFIHRLSEFFKSRLDTIEVKHKEKANARDEMERMLVLQICLATTF